MDNFGLGGVDLSKGQMFQVLIRLSVASLITYYSVKWMMNQLDPTSKNKKKAKILAEEQLKRYLFTLNKCNCFIFTLIHTRSLIRFADWLRKMALNSIPRSLTTTS